MLSDSQRQMVQTKGVVLGRVLLGLLFVWSGAGMLMSGGDSSYFESIGIPLAGIVVWLVIILKIGAGGALIIGKKVGLAAALLILFTIAATLIAHMDVNDIGLFKNLSIIGGLLYAMAFGGGSWSAPAPKAVEPAA